MRVLMQGLGFAAHPSPGDSGVLEYTLDLSEDRVQLS